MSKPVDPSPFHPGERAIQNRLGVADRAEMLGRRMIRDHLTAQHREFFAGLPFVLLGAIDDCGQPWASPVFGRPGFVSTPTARLMKLQAPLLVGDPLVDPLQPGADVGLLGIEYATRRRNRVSARVRRAGEYLELDVVQTFGNCPQYIQARTATLLPMIDEPVTQRTVVTIEALTERDTGLIAAADNFTIASHHAGEAGVASVGADVSHRGGPPGFVRVQDANTLEFPDYPGNNLFNTLGNIASDGRAGLTFMDFECGDLLYLTGNAEIVWEPLADAERHIRFRIHAGRRLERAAPLRWKFIDYAPQVAARLQNNSPEPLA